MANENELLERLTIREIVENWALLRDARRWDRFRELWHEEGRMITTWIEGSFEEFIKASQAAYEKASPSALPRGHHHRPQAQSRHRSDEADDRVMIDGVLCDVVCTGRFYFFLEKRKGRWGIVLFQPILEKDRLDPVDPSTTLSSTGNCSHVTRKDIAILLTRWCTPARKFGPTCRAWTAPRLTPSTHEAPLGSRASRWKCLREEISIPA